jgi:hypothetical protein
MTSSNDPSPLTPRTPQLNVTIPKSNELLSQPSQTKSTSPKIELEDEDRQYWEEEDEGYWGEMEEEDEEKDDLEETYRNGI